MMYGEDGLVRSALVNDGGLWLERHNRCSRDSDWWGIIIRHVSEDELLTEDGIVAVLQEGLPTR